MLLNILLIIKNYIFNNFGRNIGPKLDATAPKEYPTPNPVITIFKFFLSILPCNLSVIDRGIDAELVFPNFSIVYKTLFLGMSILLTK